MATSASPSTSLLDLSQPIHARVAERLDSESIMWLGSVRSDGRPHFVPVWFLWHDEAFIIFSQPGNQKIKNIRHSSLVSLSLETENGGGGVSIFEGTAELSVESATDMLATIGPAYERKYADGLRGLGLTMDSMAAEYSQVIRITPNRLMAW